MEKSDLVCVRHDLTYEIRIYVSMCLTTISYTTFADNIYSMVWENVRMHLEDHIVVRVGNPTLKYHRSIFEHYHHI